MKIRMIPVRWLVIMLICGIISPLSAPVSAEENNFWFDIWQERWSKTRFDQRDVSLTDFIETGPIRNQPQTLQSPAFQSAQTTALDPSAPLISIYWQGEAKAYPLAYLIWHHLIEDQIGEIPILVSFCPLCQATRVYDRRTQTDILTFGTTGLQYQRSIGVIFDRQTESWWSQLDGRALVGELNNQQLTALPTHILPVHAFQKLFPDGQIMQQPNSPYPYGQTPYAGMSALKYPPFGTDLDEEQWQLPSMAEVIVAKGYAWDLESVRQKEDFQDQGLRLQWFIGMPSLYDRRSLKLSKDQGFFQITEADQLVPSYITFAHIYQGLYPNRQIRR